LAYNVRLMRVYLIRHAIAFERNAKRWSDDRRRPLTPLGIKKFRKAAAGLGRVAGVVECVLTSPLVRARQTADILASVADWPAPLEAPELAPGRTPAQVLALIRSRPVEALALVGHEPGLSQLLAVCVAGAEGRLRVEFKKGGVACLLFSAAARPGQAQLEWLLAPKLLRALA
jgi:phosphohistidine phosphatase